MATDHTNRGIRSGFMFFGFMFLAPTNLSQKQYDVEQIINTQIQTKTFKGLKVA